MLNYRLVLEKKMTLQDLATGLTQDDLRALTHEMVDTMLGMIAGCTDADVAFVPLDPTAEDTYAATEVERNIAWTLGHIVVHTTASAEESAFLAAEMARGVPNHGRSRYETPWQGVTTIAECRARFEESRRIRLATLAVWPDPPHTEVIVEPYPGAGTRDCYARFIGGLMHDASHLGQIAEVVRQAAAARMS